MARDVSLNLVVHPKLSSSSLNTKQIFLSNNSVLYFPMWIFIQLLKKIFLVHLYPLPFTFHPDATSFCFCMTLLLLHRDRSSCSWLKEKILPENLFFLSHPDTISFPDSAMVYLRPMLVFFLFTYKQGEKCINSVAVNSWGDGLLSYTTLPHPSAWWSKPIFRYLVAGLTDMHKIQLTFSL